MNIASTSPQTSNRVRRVAGLVLLAQAVAGAVLVGASAAMLLPVVTTAGSVGGSAGGSAGHPAASGATAFTVASIDIGVGALVPLVLGALVLLVPALADDRRARWVESSLSSSITVFLIAELNGIRELGTLVAMYALTSAAVLFAALQDGRRDVPRMLPSTFGAMVGIVPWGLIAWYEIAPVVAGDPGPATWVRVLTIVVLALFVAASVLVWRGAGGSRAGGSLAGGSLAGRSLAALAVSVVTRSAMAWGVVAAVAAGLSVGSVG